MVKIKNKKYSIIVILYNLFLKFVIGMTCFHAMCLFNLSVILKFVLLFFKATTIWLTLLWFFWPQVLDRNLCLTEFEIAELLHQWEVASIKNLIRRLLKTFMTVCFEHVSLTFKQRKTINKSSLYSLNFIKNFSQILVRIFKYSLLIIYLPKFWILFWKWNNKFLRLWSH